MTIASEVSRVDYLGDGSNTTFPIPFVFSNVGEISAWVVDANGGITKLASGSFAVSGGNGSGGTLTYPTSGAALASGWKLVVMREVPLLQSQSIDNQGGFYPKVVENGLDYLTKQTQQITEKVGRTLQMSIGDTAYAGVIPSPAARKGRVLGFDGSGALTTYATGTGVSPSDAQDVDFTAAYAGAVARSVADKLSDTVCVFDFMTREQITDVRTNTAALDVTAAVQAALDLGGRIRMPGGKYRVTAPLTMRCFNAPQLIGDGQENTIILNDQTGHLLNVQDTGFSRCRIADMSLQQLATPLSSGAPGTGTTLINSAVGIFRLEIERVMFVDYAVGIRSGDNVIVCRDCEWRDGVTSSGIGIFLTGQAGGSVLDNLVFNVPTGGRDAQPLCGIYVKSCGGLLISNSNIIMQGNDLLIAPDNGDVVATIFAQNTWFDSAVAGIAIEPKTGGAVVRCRFMGCWTSSHTSDGVYITPQGGGVINGIHFVDHVAIECGQSGLSVADNASANDIVVNGGIFGQNINGIYIGQNNQEFSIQGASCGFYGGVSGNTAYGISVNAGCDNFIVAGNRCGGNTSGGVNDSSGGSNKYVANNLA